MLNGKQNTFYFEASNSNYNETPVVCLLGWAGAKDNNLRKYAQIYSDLGFHTIRFSPSFKLTFFESAQTHKKYAYEFMNKLKNEYKLVDNPILIHSFSNAGGFIIYQYILNEIRNKQSLYDFIGRNQMGLIYDSSPGWPPNQFIKFTQSVYSLIENTNKGVKGYIQAALFVALFKTYCLVQFGNDYYSRFFKTLLTDHRQQIPTLFLYSKADKLVDSENIEKFIRERQKRLPKLKIQSKDYLDAEHCMIYQKYPDDYLKQIKHHLNTCKLMSKL